MKSGDRKKFLTCEKPLLTAMVQAQTPQECNGLMESWSQIRNYFLME